MTLAAWTAFAFVGYLIALGLYRLFFSPLARARIPGPKLAALSGFYEAWYEVVKQGKLAFKLDELHEKYGPIVQVTPEEVHIKDSSFWDALYVKHPKANRDRSTAGRFGNDDSMFSAVDASIHRQLRAPLNPFFSRRSIMEQQSLVQDKANILMEGMSKLKGTGSVFRVTNAFGAFAGDVISQYSFGFSYGQVENYQDGWKDNFHDAYVSLGAFGHVTVQYPWMHGLLQAIPESVTLKMDPSLGKMIQLQKDFVKTINNVKAESDVNDKKNADKTIFHALLQADDMPSRMKATTRLEHEAQTVIGGGIVTTAWALTQSVFYILNNPDVHEKLLAELRGAVPDMSAPDAFAYEKLEHLPYLGGCVREGVRFSMGISGRNPRVLHEPIVYKDYTIPAGTAISMSVRDVNFDGGVFDEPKRYKPDRWIGAGGPPKAADGSSLDSYFVGFGKGSRMCLGINLAYMELYIVLAQLFRRFSLELYETDASDVELAHDFFLPSPKLDSKGVRVRVTGELQ